MAPRTTHRTARHTTPNITTLLVARHWSACQRKQQHLAMACVSTVASTSDVPQAVMSQRLGDLLLQFPSAAIGGVQWCVLARKYEERFSARLDARSLGHTSALSLATTLLWDVARLVDVTDTDNPILALEDGVALSPPPGCIGSWPSLYSSLCTIVQNNGADELQATQATAVSRHAGRSLLLSRVKPLLQAHWHAHFDEASFSYWNEQGATVKVKKLKHLITAVLRWRSERLTWLLEEGRKPSTLERALLVKLELAPASCQNDLLLSCVQDERAMEEMLKSPGTGVPAQKRDCLSLNEDRRRLRQSMSSSTIPSSLLPRSLIVGPPPCSHQRGRIEVFGVASPALSSQVHGLTSRWILRTQRSPP